MNRYKIGFRQHGKWTYSTVVCTEEQSFSIFLAAYVAKYDKVSIEVIERNIDADEFASLI